jgi:hypothetical protein
MKCRCCSSELKNTFLDLGFAPPSNAYLTESDKARPETYFPLKVMVCDSCWLVQTEDYTEANKLFDASYAYFSSTSKSWLAHAKKYSEEISKKLSLNKQSLVVEVASNDGYLLKNFVEMGIPCLGIEPTEGTAIEAKKLGIPVKVEFFGEEFAKELLKEGYAADLIVGNNVFAHVPNIIDFSLGLKVLLKNEGTINLEFPHLLRLIESNQFDTIYHEHFSYLSLCAAENILGRAGLRIYDVELLQTHGGSLRVHICHAQDKKETSDSVKAVRREEFEKGINSIAMYHSFQKTADAVKNELITFLIEQKNAGKIVAAYGAAAKGNTILNYAGIKPDLLGWVYDAALSKQNKFMPGSHIPILSPTTIVSDVFDYLLILPWNIADEVMEQNSDLNNRGIKFVTAVPKLRIR